MIWQPIQPETPLVPPRGSGIITPNKGRNARVWRRTDEIGENCPLVRSAAGFETIPPQEWRQYIEGGSQNSGLVYNVQNQASVGSCGSESALGALKLVREAMGLKRVEFSPYAMYGRVNGGRDVGSSLGANLKHIRDIGSPTERSCPRSKGWRQRMSEAALLEAAEYKLDEYYEVTNWAEFGSALLQGWIVYWGYSGHAIVAVDIINESQFIYLNSWGQWGTGTQYSKQYNDLNYGFGTISRSKIYWPYGVYCFRSATIASGDLELATSA